MIKKYPLTEREPWYLIGYRERRTTIIATFARGTEIKMRAKCRNGSEALRASTNEEDTMARTE
jgi:hypothetical protein